jgi:hypothetical protein
MFIRAKEGISEKASSPINDRLYEHLGNSLSKADPKF